MSKLTDKASNNRDDIVSFFSSTPGLIVGGLIGVGFVAVVILGAIFGWF